MATFRPYEGSSPYVYVSYSHEDKEIVLDILKKLHTSGLRIWYDRGIQPGNTWQDYNANHIKNCHTFLFFVSSNSVNSEECKYEIQYACDNLKAILPIYLEKMNSEEIGEGLKFRLSRWQAIFFYKYDDHLEEFYNEIIFTENLKVCKETNKFMVNHSNENNTKPSSCLKQALKYYEEKEFYKAAQIFEELAKNGNAEAMRNLGWMYLKNEIAKGKFVTGISWLEKAADNGNSDAINQLGLIYYHGDFMTQNLEIAEEYFFRAADAGNSSGMYNLARMYLDGEIPNSKPFDGVQWLEKSAGKGNAEAMNRLGILCHEGKIVEQNLEVAEEYFRDAANSGNSWGMYNLAQMYLNEKINVGSIKEGIELLNSAAEQGNDQALYDLSQIYEYGKFGIKRNKIN